METVGQINSRERNESSLANIAESLIKIVEIENETRLILKQMMKQNEENADAIIREIRRLKE